MSSMAYTGASRFLGRSVSGPPQARCMHKSFSATGSRRMFMRSLHPCVHCMQKRLASESLLLGSCDGLCAYDPARAHCPPCALRTPNPSMGEAPTVSWQQVCVCGACAVSFHSQRRGRAGRFCCARAKRLCVGSCRAVGAVDR